MSNASTKHHRLQQWFGRRGAARFPCRVAAVTVAAVTAVATCVVFATLMWQPLIHPIGPFPQTGLTNRSIDDVTTEPLEWRTRRAEGVCRPIQDALQDYITPIAEPFIRRNGCPEAFPQRIVYRVLSTDWSGFGSNAKGIATLLFFAIVTRVPLVLQSDAPQLADFFQSEVVYVEPNVTLGIGSATRRCDVAMKAWLIEADRDRTTLETLVTWFGSTGDARDSMFCDRHLIHLFMQFRCVREQLSTYVGLFSMRPRDISGCLLAEALQPNLRTRKLLGEALRPYTAAAVQRAHPHLLAIQLRLGGSDVSWDDPARVEAKSRDRVLRCVSDHVRAYVRAMRELEQTRQVRAPSYFVVVSSDSPNAYQQLTELVPVDRRIEFEPRRFYHTARSIRLPHDDSNEIRWNEAKIVVDFLLLSVGTLHMFSRSSFGEVAAWIGSSWRDQSPATPLDIRLKLGMRSSTMVNVHELCLGQKEDCSTQTC